MNICVVRQWPTPPRLCYVASPTSTCSTASGYESSHHTSMSLPSSFLSRRMRLAVLCGLLIVLVFVSNSLLRPLPDLRSRFRYSTHQNGSPELEVQDYIGILEGSSVRWADFAYVQYVTNPSYLCNSLMILEALRRHETKADLLMLYPRDWIVPIDDYTNASYESVLLAHARDLYDAKLRAIEVKTFINEEDPTWQDSYTKLLAWSQTQYKRVISLDSDATVLNVSFLFGGYELDSHHAAHGRALLPPFSSSRNAPCILDGQLFSLITAHCRRAFRSRMGASTGSHGEARRLRLRHGYFEQALRKVEYGHPTSQIRLDHGRNPAQGS
jgi:hypothetical protein